MKGYGEQEARDKRYEYGPTYETTAKSGGMVRHKKIRITEGKRPRGELRANTDSRTTGNKGDGRSQGLHRHPREGEA